jgi:hypothetical protein
MARTSIRLLASVVLVFLASSGCQLLVPSNDELTGERDRPADAGLDAGDTGAVSTEGGIDGGSVRLVQQTTITGSSTPSVTLTLPAAPRSGDALILTIAALEVGGATPTFTLSGGGVSWSSKSRSSMHVVSAIWGGFAGSAGTTSVTVTASSAQTTLVAHLSEWSGVGAFGASPKASAGNGPIATAALEVSRTTRLVYAAAASHGTKLSAPANGFVALETVVQGDVQITEAYLLSPSAGSYATAWSEVTPTGNGWDAHVLSLTE